MGRTSSCHVVDRNGCEMKSIRGRICVKLTFPDCRLRHLPASLPPMDAVCNRSSLRPVSADGSNISPQ